MFMTEKQIERIRNQYPPGTRLAVMKCPMIRDQSKAVRLERS